MANAQPKNNDDRGWRLLGLAWAGKDKGATQKALRELLAAQRADGGWSDLDSMESGAYATGKALFALQTAGLSPSDAACQRMIATILVSDVIPASNSQLCRPDPREWQGV